MPALASSPSAQFNFNIPGGTADPKFGDILNTLRTEPVSLTNEYSNLLAPLMANINRPQAERVKASGAADMAALTSMYQKRGLTGSSTEAHALAGAQSQMALNLDTLDQQSTFQIVSMLSDALKFDVTRNDAIVQLIAQAMGQELTSQRDMQMFRDQLKATMDMAGAARKAAERQAIIGAVGSAVGAGGSAAIGKWG